MNALDELKADTVACRQAIVVGRRMNLPAHRGGAHLLDEEMAFVRSMLSRFYRGPAVSFSVEERAELARLYLSTTTARERRGVE